MILPGDDPRARARALQCLQDGALVGLPTETVYGLAADACNDAAVARIFAAKGRPADHPLIVHVADAQAAHAFAAEVPDFAAALMQAFWPGPLTLILPRRAGVAEAAAGGQPTVGLRCPDHPVAQALLQACRAAQPPMSGLAAPSANLFGRVSPTRAAHVQEEFGPDLLVLDGGPCQVGIESTIVDCTRGLPVLLRPGVLTPERLSAACGQKVLLKEELPSQMGQGPKASGTLESHYAPRARVRLVDQAALGQSDAAPAQSAGRLALYARQLPPAGAGRLLRRMPDTPQAAAHDLFAALRELDAAGATDIWVEQPPPGSDWDGVRDRLSRAAAR
ncbi:MAG: threonylcarbamoyl-AMP synthase [Rhodoferax sp.]|nr:threonylcarbamoyl-AMP synthase [Rhodoferax sp.]